VPYPPAVRSTLLGRVIAQRMQENWGQTVIVENRPARTMIGTAAAAKADPDGYTLLIAVSAHTTIRHSMRDAVRLDQDFAPVALLAARRCALLASSLRRRTSRSWPRSARRRRIRSISARRTGSMTHLTGSS